MPLSKETTDQIRKESKKWALSDCDTMSSIAYREGAEKYAVWKEKAEVYEKALKWYKDQADLAKATKDKDSLLSIVTALQLDGGARATKALEQWK